MTIENFINENRKALINCIQNVCSNCEMADDDIEDWVWNDESLYNWAISEGVEI